jgi:hypothetical protein
MTSDAWTSPPVDRSLSMVPPEPKDAFNHPFPEDPWWQESAVFTWSDPKNGLGGEYRFAFHPYRELANLYSWSIFGGEIVDKRLERDLEIPDGDLLQMTLADLSVETVEPLHEYRIVMNGESLQIDLTWRSFMEPTTMTLNHAGATLATGHYNCLGRATGKGSFRGSAFEIRGDGFHDHSWGRRKEQLPGSRWIVAVFDPGFYIMAMPVLGSDRSSVMLGYVCEGGKLRRLVGDVEMGYSFRDDWITPAACDARLFDEDGRGYRLIGKSVGPSSSQPFPEGKFVTHAQAEFECGGRIGHGIIESTAPRFLSPGQLAELSLPSDHFLNAPFPE